METRTTEQILAEDGGQRINELGIVTCNLPFEGEAKERALAAMDQIWEELFEQPCATLQEQSSSASR